MTDDRCVPLCGADIAYGRRAGWWKHEPLCPARDGRKPGAKRENVECRTCAIGPKENTIPCRECGGTRRTPGNVDGPT